MAASRRTSISRLINRLMAQLPCEGGAAMEGHFKILGETVDADAFAILQIHPGKGDARILGGSGLRTPIDKWQMQLETPYLAEQSANFSDVPALAVEGSFADDPFLGGEGVRSLLFKPVVVGEMCLATIALRRDKRTFKKNEIERFAAVSGVINMLGLFSHFLEEHDALRSTDKLTGLGLFSEFHETMVKELSRARRGGGTVTMGILSVVPQGSVSTDNALLDVTRTFQGQLRNFDTLVRYGSMELAFILPDLRSAEGLRVVDRVMREIVSSLGGEGKAPNIYVGLSCYPEDSATVERLIEMAEAAMNQAHEESRPGVYRWEE
jgi:diguanylate cyclase (GGDEF)-like protein